MSYQRKTADEFELQADHGYGHGWECETTETTRKAIRERVREYRANCPGMPIRVKKRRVPISPKT